MSPSLLAYLDFVQKTVRPGQEFVELAAYKSIWASKQFRFCVSVPQPSVPQHDSFSQTVPKPPMASTEVVGLAAHAPYIVLTPMKDDHGCRL